MIKVFISQPMNGKTEEEIMAVRQEAIESVKRMHDEEEVEIIDSFFEDYDPQECNAPDSKLPVKFLARSIDMLADADEVYFCEGWQTARGCCIEFNVAEGYGIPMILPF